MSGMVVMRLIPITMVMYHSGYTVQCVYSLEYMASLHYINMYTYKLWTFQKKSWGDLHIDSMIYMTLPPDSSTIESFMQAFLCSYLM